MTVATARLAERRSGLLAPVAGAEVTLALLTVAAIVGLGRLFSEGSFLPPVLAAGLAAHVLSALLRRREASPLATGAVLGAGWILAVTWAVVPGTTILGLPTAETFDVLRQNLAAAWTVFGEDLAPVPPLPGFVAASATAAFGLAMLADVAAFRLSARFESVVPSLTMFAFAATLGAPRHRVLATALYGAALLAHLAVHHTALRERGVHWLSGSPAPVRHSIVRRAAGIGAAVLGVAVLAGPHLPGVDADAVVPWRDLTNDGPDNRVTVSPLVDIRGRLVSQSNLEVFTVEASQRAYWRLTSLDTFDGRIWSAVASYRDASGALPVPRLPLRDEQRVVQRFKVSGLATVWLPAAYQPAAVSSPGHELRYDRDSGSLISERETAIGLEYEVESLLPSFDAAALSGVRSASEVDARYRSLPNDFSPRAAALARDITAGARTPYDAALQLQQFFHEQFTYSLNVPSGHSNDDIEAFLFGERVGYCEQFAGSYAALARSIGLPARVAVGFTPGEAGDDGLLHVRGEHAHAWPEVWIDGAGWVAFEPTPGRGAPGAEGYTGLPEQQAATGDSATATTLPPAGPSNPVPTTAPTDTTGGVSAGQPDAPTPEVRIKGDGGAGWWSWLWMLLLVTVLVGLAALGSALRNRRVHQRRRSSATLPSERIAVAWEEAVEALQKVESGPWPGETPDELAQRLDGHGGPLDVLAGVASVAAYGPGEPDEHAVTAARSASTRLVDEVRRSVPARTRVRWAVDPRGATGEARGD